MTLRTSMRLAGALALALLATTGCSRDPGPLRPWPLSTDPIVFDDAFTGAVEFQAFGNSQLDALGTDATEQYLGTGCIRVTVPVGNYAGGAFVTTQPRDLTGYNALTFYAKASRAVTVDVAGLGNDNTGTSKFEARRNAIPVTTAWTRVVVPVPLPARLSAERGLFFFAAAPQGGSGYVLWFDDIRFEHLAGVTNPRPAMTSQTLNTFVGATASVTATRTTFDLAPGDSVVVGHMPGYFAYASSAPSVATVDDGIIRVVGQGTASITARLDTTLARGAITVSAAPFTPGLAPVPALPAASVISLFSNAYANRPVDKWSADWDVADVTSLSIGGDDLKLYTNMVYAGIEFTSNTVDATAMTHFHIDVWVPAGTTFQVKLVDFGAERHLRRRRRQRARADVQRRLDAGPGDRQLGRAGDPAGGLHQPPRARPPRPADHLRRHEDGLRGQRLLPPVVATGARGAGCRRDGSRKRDDAGRRGAGWRARPGRAAARSSTRSSA